MLDQLYDVAAVRRFLTESGARRLGGDDVDLPPILKILGGEHWILQVNWKLTDRVVVNLGEFYPDEPPSVYLPAQDYKKSLIPHVGSHGHVCTFEEGVAVNPNKALEVLNQALAIAKTILDRDWSDAETLQEIKPELGAYWNLEATTKVLYAREQLDRQVVELVSNGSEKTIFEINSSPVLPAESNLALILHSEEESILSFLRDPKKFVTESAEFKKALETLPAYVAKRNKKLKRIRVFFICIFRLGEDECVLVGSIEKSIAAKPASATNLAQNVYNILRESTVIASKCEDISTKRLMRRSIGPSFPSKLLTSKVAIIGCGSLGGFVTDGLSRCGIRNYFLCDTETLHPANLPRHVLPKWFLYKTKVSGMAILIHQRLPDAEVKTCTQDIRHNEAIVKLKEFSPDLVFFATGDTNTDLTMAQILPGPLCFSWMDPNFEAGHLIYQPPEHATVLRALHSGTEGLYKHSSPSAASKLLKESGCQAGYSPYSGLDMILFASIISKTIVDWLVEPPKTSRVLKTKGWTPWEDMPL